MTSTAPPNLNKLIEFVGNKITGVHLFFYRAFNIDIHQMSKTILIAKIKLFICILNHEYKHMVLRDDADVHNFWSRIFTEDLPNDSPICVLNKLANITIYFFNYPPSCNNFAQGPYLEIRESFHQQARNLIPSCFPNAHCCLETSYQKLYQPIVSNSNDTKLFYGFDVILTDGNGNQTKHFIDLTNS